MKNGRKSVFATPQPESHLDGRRRRGTSIEKDEGMASAEWNLSSPVMAGVLPRHEPDRELLVCDEERVVEAKAYNHRWSQDHHAGDLGRLDDHLPPHVV